MKSFYVFILILLFSCHKATKRLDFVLFSIEVPKTWEKIKVQGIDSYVVQLH
jgi:hypothetical protein